MPTATRLDDLRHGLATLLLAAGGNPKVVADLLCHSTTRLALDTYRHALRELTRQAADHLDAILSRQRLLWSCCRRLTLTASGGAPGAVQRLQTGPAWTDLGLVFADARGYPLDLHRLRREFYRVLVEAGLQRVVPYALRHTRPRL